MSTGRKILEHIAVRALLFTGLLFSVMLIACGCGAFSRQQDDISAPQTETQPEPVKIGMSFDSFVIERWLRDRDVFVSAAQSMGADVNVQNANGDVQEQIEQIEYLIEKDMDVIAIVPIESGSLEDVVRRARSSGIRIICYDRLIKNAGADLYISFDNVKVGTLMGQALAEALPEGGSVFQIQGSSGDNNVAMVREGFEEAINGKNITVTYSAFCDNWLAELAFDAVNTGLEENGGKADGIMCGNDDLAGQAIRALTENKLAGRIPVVAQDAELSACQRIVEGTQTMTVYKPVDDEARTAARFAVALARGDDITDETASLHTTETIDDGTYEIPYYPLEPVAVTKDNMDEVIIDGGFHQRDDVYLNVN